LTEGGWEFKKRLSIPSPCGLLGKKGETIEGRGKLEKGRHHGQEFVRVKGGVLPRAGGRGQLTGGGGREGPSGVFVVWWVSYASEHVRLGGGGWSWGTSEWTKSETKREKH